MKKINYGKRFESDFQSSVIKAMDVTRLKDAPSSFNKNCTVCKHNRIRFTPKNICDFICYSYPNIFYIELKSHKGKSIPFAAICKNPKDTRLFEMVEKEENKGVYSFVIFNWRDIENKTYVVPAESVNEYIKYSPRKSIPYAWTFENGVRLDHKLKRIRYSYDIKKWLEEFNEYTESLN